MKMSTPEYYNETLFEAIFIEITELQSNRSDLRKAAKHAKFG